MRGEGTMALKLRQLDRPTGIRPDGIDAYDNGGHGEAGESDAAYGSAPEHAPSAIALDALDGTNGFRLDGIDASDYSGGAVAGAGDVNGDGIDDLIIGASGADPSGRYQAGESYVVFGSATGFTASLDLAALDGANGFRLGGIDELDGSGGAVAGAGDVNGDGIDDLIIGAQGAAPDDRAEAGESYVVFGSSASFPASLDLSSLDGTNGFRLDGTDNSDYSGTSVAGAGDVNGDGIGDLIIGAHLADLGGRLSAGESYVVFGAATGFAASLDLAVLDGTNGFSLDGAAFDQAGFSVAGAGDVSGDGIDDLIIGAPGAIQSYVVFGTAAGFDASLDLAALDGSNGFRLDDGGGGSGVSVAGAGDVNGDGIDDLIVGAYRAYSGETYGAGESYVVFGTAAGFDASVDLAALDGSNGFRLTGIDRNDNSGLSVAGAGDVNGDGFDDLIVGAPGGDPDGVYSGESGESYVVFGFPSAEAGSTAASVTASSDDAEQGVRGRMQLASHDLDIGQRAGKPVGLRFTGLEVPDGATITGAYIEFQAKRSGARPADITIAIEDTTDAAAFGCGQGSIAKRDYLDQTTDWTPERWVKGEFFRTADLAATIAALVGTDGLDADDALAFRFEGMGERTAWSFDGKGAPARLVIEFETGAGPPVVPVDQDLQDDDFRFLGAKEPHASVWDDPLLA
jgi:hypothetical protein